MNLPLCTRTRIALALTAITISLPPISQAQDEFDGIEVVESNLRDQISFIIEYFQLDHRTANKLIREFAPRAADAGELRDRLGAMIEAGDARLIETGWIRGESGQRAKSESIREDIYPTEYDPPEMPRSVGDITIIETSVTNEEKKKTSSSEAVQHKSSSGAPIPHMTSANPAAFETRNVGLTIEVDPVINFNKTYIDISLIPELIDRLEDKYFLRPGLEHTARGIEHISMPQFYTNRITTQLTALPGNYNLLGIHTSHDSPEDRILVLLKSTLFQAR